MAKKSGPIPGFIHSTDLIKHLYIVRSAGLGKIFCNFRNNPVVLLILFDTFVKCSSNVNLLSKVNPKCFCHDA